MEKEIFFIKYLQAEKLVHTCMMAILYYMYVPSSYVGAPIYFLTTAYISKVSVAITCSA